MITWARSRVVLMTMLAASTLVGCTQPAATGSRTDCEYRRGVMAAAIADSSNAEQAVGKMEELAGGDLEWYACPDGGRWLEPDYSTGTGAISCSLHGVPGQ